MSFWSSFKKHFWSTEFPAAFSNAMGSNNPVLMHRREQQLEERKEQLQQAVEHMRSRTSTPVASRNASPVPSRPSTPLPTPVPSRSTTGSSTVSAGEWQQGGKKTRRLRRKNKMMKTLKNTRLRRAHRVK